MRDNKTYYNEFSKWYEKQRHKGYHAMIDNLQYDLIEKAVTNREVLEVGCGTGLILQRTAEVAKRAVGVDLSPGMLETARERGLEVLEGSATELPFPDSSFDVVYSFKVLAHVKEIDKALSEAMRVTRPHGLLFLDFYNKHSLRYVAKRVAGPGMISEKTNEGALYTRWDTPSEAIARLPQGAKLQDVYGVRVLTPFAGAYKVPIVSSILGEAERLVCKTWPFARFGGFLVLKISKED